MSDTNYAQSLSLLLAHEGGFVNNPKDPGGPTNKGITQKVYDRYRIAKALPVRSVKLIEDAEVADIYRNEYWNEIDGDKLPAGIDYAVFDYAVNSGITRAVADLQRCINKNANFYGVSGQLKVDGRFGTATEQAAVKAGENGATKLIEDYCDRRLSFMKSLKTWGTFGKGWQRRVEGKNQGAEDGDDGVVDFAVKMANAPKPVIIANPAKPDDAASGFTTPHDETATVLTPPTAIGAYHDEAPGKAFSSQVAVWRTVQGAGAALAAAGVTGNTALDAAATVKGHIAGTILGQLALVAFVLCMVAGIGLVLYKFFEERAEKKAS